MKIQTRTSSWGIELSNDTVKEEIIRSNQIELKETIINFLEASYSMANLLDSDYFKKNITRKMESCINILEKM